MESKFKFYEIVKVIATHPDFKKIYGREGQISGKSQEDDGSWGYCISFSEGTWCVAEKDIIHTGKFANPENNKNAGKIRVHLMPDGSGKIVDN